jgi:hypothetical protein
MVLKTNRSQCRLCILVLLAAWIRHAQAQSSSPNPSPTSANDFFALVPTEIPKAKSVSNQNFTRCCLRALKDWRNNPSNPNIQVQSSKNPYHVFENESDLLKNGADEQFPCGAEYQHSKQGAMRVKISYTWCKANCGGWQRSRSAVLEQWVQPFVGFVLPAAVFCLNVRVALSR